MFGTLAHEATHYLQHVDGVKGVDSNGRHNKTFAEGARYYFGLTITKQVDWIGFSHTEVEDECAERWASVIDVIENGLAAAAGRAPVPGGLGIGGGLGIIGTTGRRGGRNKNNPKAVCGCGHIIRASWTVLAKAKPRCAECGQLFTATI